ncbi:MAG: L-threonylcarbamoyladenylate synthase [Bacteriovoracaceae bacterium]|jgi:tRNA threonylcarbamoyl adenosine modification protein (Sua5/YciO/YrdC/YwlC family)|nr:L-threonylcarbamoyladenylate synthase [Bacteriovoracaceae bacterium]
MIEYVIKSNPDDRVLQKASDLLKKGELICLPTDTNWILLADPYVKGASDKLYKIKKENASKHFSLFCKDIQMASDVAVIENTAFRILKKCIPGNYTFIFEAKKKIAKIISASKTDKEVGVRFVPSSLVEKLLDIHGDVLISTNLPKSLFSEDEQIYSYMLEDSLRGICSMIIDPGEFEFTGQSTIVSFIDDIPDVLRAGAGDISPF